MVQRRACENIHAHNYYKPNMRGPGLHSHNTHTREGGSGKGILTAAKCRLSLTSHQIGPDPEGVDLVVPLRSGGGRLVVVAVVVIIVMVVATSIAVVLVVVAVV